jgi:hypothetical protein
LGDWLDPKADFWTAKRADVSELIVMDSGPVITFVLRGQLNRHCEHSE